MKKYDVAMIGAVTQTGIKCDDYMKSLREGVRFVENAM